MTVTAAANTATSARTGTINVSGTGVIAQTISVTQAGSSSGPSTGPCTNPTASGTTGPLNWTLCPDGTFTLSGTGAAAPTHTASENPWYNHRYDITSAVINSGVTEVGSFFDGCSNLVSATIPETVTSIEIAAFQLCSKLGSITIPNSVTSINSYAFFWCSSLPSITIPASVNLIGSQAFGRCTSLSVINVNTGNADYLSDGGVLYNKSKTLLHTYPAGKDGSTFNVPNTVTSIYAAAFQGCGTLTSVTIPNSVTSIGQLAFNSCNKLTDVTVAWTTPLAVPANTFSGVDIAAVTLHVPAGTEALYKAAPVWKDFRYSTPSITVSPASLDFAAAGGEKALTITSNTSWTVSKDAAWLTVSPASGSNDGTVTVTAAANTATSARTGTITIAGTGVSSQTVSVTQAAAVSPTLSVSPDSLKFTAAGEQKTFAITSNTNWTVSKDAAWFTITPSSGSNNGTVTVTAAANTTTNLRTAAITITSMGVSPQTVSVGQAAAASPTLSVSPDTLKFTAAGEQKTFAITSNTSWAVSKDAAWLTITPSSGSNNGTVFVTAAANTTTNMRTAAITISSSGANPQTVSVGQAAATIAVTGVSLNYTSLEKKAGDSAVVLVATVTPSNATNKSVTWSTSNAQVATVTNGTVHFVSAGTATITVTTVDGNHTATCQVTVSSSVGTEAVDAANIKAYFHNSILYVSSPTAETVEVYSFSGERIFSAKKDAGEASFFLPISREAVIVRGSSGWTLKIIDN